MKCSSQSMCVIVLGRIVRGKNHSVTTLGIIMKPACLWVEFGAKTRQKTSKSVTTTVVMTHTVSSFVKEKAVKTKIILVRTPTI